MDPHWALMQVTEESTTAFCGKRDVPIEAGCVSPATSVLLA